MQSAQLDRLRTFFVVDNDLVSAFPAKTVVEIKGRLRCRFGLFHDVRETIDLDDRNRLRAVQYRYHAGVEGNRARPVFRYDNAHPYAREKHTDDHHRYRYDHSTWREIEPPEWIGKEHRPHLWDALDELHDWWHGAGRFLDLS